MIISERQHQSNQRNAQKSTGPKTPEGKAKTSMNALKHGLRARRTPLPCESEKEFQELCDALEAEWQPQTPSEQFFVEQMATSQWLLARLAIRERFVFELLFQSDPTRDRSLREQVEFYARQKSRLERSYAKAVRDLHQLRQSRRAAARPQPVKASAPQPEPFEAHFPTPCEPGQPQPAQANVS